MKINRYLKDVASLIYALTIYPIGYVVYVFAAYLRAFAFVLMLQPGSCKKELKKAFKVSVGSGDYL